MKALVIVGAVLVGLVVASMAGSKPRERVGPWDFPDAKNPYKDAPAGAPLVGDPKSFIQANKNLATLPDGTTVELVGLSRTLQGPQETGFSVVDRSWRPDGGPYLGEALQPSGYNQRYCDLENKGARYLAFRIASRHESLDVYGYLPETSKVGSPNPEMHGRDIPSTVPIWQGSAIYRPPIAVDDMKANRYLFAVASGPWTTAATITAIPTPPVDKVLATGPWGKLHMIPPKPVDRIGYSKLTIPVITFRIEPDEPRQFCYRMHLYDENGVELGLGRIWPRVDEQSVPQTSFGGVAHGIPPSPKKTVISKIVIETCPYIYIEFGGIHFDPEPKLWDKSYWGKEGEQASSIASGTRLDGIIAPVPDAGSWKAAELYAPDGKRWREYPNPNMIQPQFSGGEWPAGTPYVAILNLDKAILDQGRNARVGFFASDSPTPGVGLGEKLETRWPLQFDREANQAPFVLKKPTPYVQAAVRYSDEKWSPAGEAAPPTDPLRRLDEKDIDSIRRGTKVYAYSFVVFLWENGRMSYFYHTPTEVNVGRETGVKWDPSIQYRLVARLKNGKTMALQNDSVGMGTGGGNIGFNFYPDEKGDHWLGWNKTKVRLEDVEAFVVETRGYTEPVYVVAKMPEKPAARQR